MLPHVWLILSPFWQLSSTGELRRMLDSKGVAYSPHAGGAELKRLAAKSLSPRPKMPAPRQQTGGGGEPRSRFAPAPAPNSAVHTARFRGAANPGAADAFTPRPAVDRRPRQQPGEQRGAVPVEPEPSPSPSPGRRRAMGGGGGGAGAPAEGLPPARPKKIVEMQAEICHQLGIDTRRTMTPVVSFNI